jgi:hypothetical protein
MCIGFSLIFVGNRAYPNPSRIDEEDHRRSENAALMKIRHRARIKDRRESNSIKIVPKTSRRGKKSSTFVRKKYENVTPVYDAHTRNKLQRYWQSIPHTQKRNSPPCGIMYSIVSINGSNTDYDVLKSVGKGKGWLRLNIVVREVLASIARIRNIWAMSSTIPTICLGKMPEILLFTDRDVVQQFNFSFGDECLFDRIIYFDDLPSTFEVLNMANYSHSHILHRLPPRPNAMKLLALFLTPYNYTLYLDGDTAPCLNFQIQTFDLLQRYDLLSTSNPFSFLSTNGQATYFNSPQHPKFETFAEINGGVIAYR